MEAAAASCCFKTTSFGSVSDVCGLDCSGCLVLEMFASCVYCTLVVLMKRTRVYVLEKEVLLICKTQCEWVCLCAAVFALSPFLFSLIFSLFSFFFFSTSVSLENLFFLCLSFQQSFIRSPFLYYFALFFLSLQTLFSLYIQSLLETLFTKLQLTALWETHTLFCLYVENEKKGEAHEALFSFFLSLHSCMCSSCIRQSLEKKQHRDTPTLPTFEHRWSCMYRSKSCRKEFS